MINLILTIGGKQLDLALFTSTTTQGRFVRTYFYVTVLLLLLFGSIGAYLAQQFAAREAMDFTPPPVTIAASHARTEQWRTYLNTVGTITATRGIDLTSEESGEITAINFESGDRVAQGQLMLVLNDDAEKASRQNQLATLGPGQITV